MRVIIFLLVYVHILFAANLSETCLIYKDETNKSLDINNSIESCIKAVNEFPKELKYLHQLGKAYSKTNDYTNAFKWYMKAAEQGDADGQTIVGAAYFFGHGVKQNYEKGFEWLMKAAEQGNADGQTMVGLAYYKGHGVKQNYEKGFEWLMKAAEQDNALAPYILGEMYYYGNLYDSAYTPKRDVKEAMKWLKKAAEQDFVDAQYSLGKMYYYGKITAKGDVVVKKDYKEAFKWYMKAAEQGNTRAQFSIGWMYYYGEGATKNHKKAFKWFMKAAEKGHVDSYGRVAMMYASGMGVRKNYKKSFEWYMKWAKTGNPLAQSRIGHAYYNGSGVKKDYIKAYAWISLALTSNDEYYRKNNDDLLLNEIETKMTPQQIAIAQSYDPLKQNNEIENESEGKKRKELQGYIGTGFFINESNIFTNNHIVENCKNIELIRKGYKSDAQIVVIDSINDLALLKAEKTNNSFLKFRAGKGIRIGDDIIVMGYPLGDLLGSGIKLTTGNISALTGLLNDTRQLQLTAPVQPGNSGGALLDKSGNVVGIIVSRLDKEQNVNMAIKSNVAQMFLDINNIDYGVAISKEKKDVADIADESKESIVQVVCYQ